MNVASLLWRYGFSLLKVNTLVGEMLNQFERYLLSIIIYIIYILFFIQFLLLK
jgi:hypothetical protein